MHLICNNWLTSSSTKSTFNRSPSLNKYSALWISLQCFGNDDDTSSRPTTPWGRSVWYHTETFSIFTFIKDKVDMKKKSCWTFGSNLFSYSRYWTGTSLQLRLTRRIFSSVNSFDVFFNDIPPMSLRCKLVPVHYREYEYGLFNKLASDFHASVLLLTTHFVITLSK